jgi:UDP-glucuronate 4-epimerase
MYRLFEKNEICDSFQENNFEMKITCADISKARKVLGYNPQIKFKEGVYDFIKWYKKIKKFRESDNMPVCNEAVLYQR